MNKAEQFEAVLLAQKPDIVTVSETWLHSNIYDHEIVPPSYTIVRKDRDTRGGGVAIVLRQGIAYTVMPEVNSVEAVWCKLLLKDGYVYVGAVYRPPNADASYLNPLLDYMNLHMLGGRIIMAGDFNLPDVNWSSLSLGPLSKYIVVAAREEET